MPFPVVDNRRLDVVRLQEALGTSVLAVKESRGDTYVIVQRDAIVDALTLLRDDADLNYEYFAECVGVDYLTWPHARDLDTRFEVIYNLYSVEHGERLFLKVGTNEGEPIPTAKHVYLGAEYPEKEIADLFGIVFEGNELVGERFMLPDDWVGFPLRKDVGLGGEDVVFHEGTTGPAVEDLMMPHAGESFEGRTGSEDVSGR